LGLYSFMKGKDILLLGLRAVVLPLSLIGGLFMYKTCSEGQGRSVSKTTHDDASQYVLPDDPDSALFPGEAGLYPVVFGPEEEASWQTPQQPSPRSAAPLEEIIDETEPVAYADTVQREFRRYAIRIDLSTNTATVSYHDIVRDDAGRWVRGEHHDIDETYRVISGTRAMPTHEGRFIRRHLLINPRWNIPKSIVAENRRFYMTARDEDGDLIYYHDGRFYTDPGPHNPLGRLFLPLRDGQGVHSTNDPRIFRRRNRYLSHGCVRYQGIEDIFVQILRHNTYRVFDVERSWHDPVEGIDPADVLESGFHAPRLFVKMNLPVEVLVVR